MVPPYSKYCKGLSIAPCHHSRIRGYLLVLIGGLAFSCTKYVTENQDDVVLPDPVPIFLLCSGYELFRPFNVAMDVSYYVEQFPIPEHTIEGGQSETL